MATQRYQPIGAESPSDEAGRIAEDILPVLLYDLDALEPFLSAETLRLHHGAYHRAHVDALSQAEREINSAREHEDYAQMRAICDSLAFNYSGHLLHTLYWQSMSPSGGGSPGGSLAEQIAADFEDWETFESQLISTALSVQGSGWAIVAWQPSGQKLAILATEKHQDVAEWGAVPVLALDMWEHAYYLDHRGDRAAYVRGFMGVADWEAVRVRFEEA